MQKPVLNSIFLSPVTEKETYDIIRNLENKRSYGIDEIPMTLVKTCINQLTSPLTFLINQSFNEGICPDKIKIAKIRPIYKKSGSQLDTCNYRPIALLPTFSKIFEKTICNRIYSFLEKYNILNENQYGFRKERSTTLAVYNYIQYILEFMQKKKYAVGLLLDMTKAYDKVSHKILLDKLYNSGIRGNAHKWFKTYLHNRTQYVEIQHYNETTHEINTVQSDIRVSNWSIPQGSVLGCTLFLLYINELPKALSPACKIVMFADDVSLLTECSDTDECKLQITENMQNTRNWLKEHNLEINMKKTKIIQFRPYQKVPLALNGLSNEIGIEEVSEFKLLGFTIDTYLNWKQHVQSVRSKLSRFVYALSILKANTNYETALSAYYAFAYSWLRYGVVLWGQSPDVGDLFISQKKCIRVLVNIGQRDSCRPYFINKKILTLPSIYIMETALFVRKNFSLFKTFESSKIQRNTRKKKKLIVPYYKLKTLAQISPFYRSAVIYNNLPNFITDEIKEETFKRNLKEWLIQKCYYSVKDFLLEQTSIS